MTRMFSHSPSSTAKERRRARDLGVEERGLDPRPPGRRDEPEHRDGGQRDRRDDRDRGRAARPRAPVGVAGRAELRRLPGDRGRRRSQSSTSGQGARGVGQPLRLEHRRRPPRPRAARRPRRTRRRSAGSRGRGQAELVAATLREVPDEHAAVEAGRGDVEGGRQVDDDRVDGPDVSACFTWSLSLNGETGVVRAMVFCAAVRLVRPTIAPIRTSLRSARAAASAAGEPSSVTTACRRLVVRGGEH